ncbi:hypothetical protein OPQ81_005067 [Rhizoctonia solani]|nr:hypothetical protein OPQ81_005067 [Rhizoctonia solani]
MLGQTATKSPTPALPNSQTKGQPHLNWQELQEQLHVQFDHHIANHTMQALQEILYEVSGNQAAPMDVENGNSEVWVLSPSPVGGGAGFHLNHPAHNQPASNSQMFKVRNRTFKQLPACPNNESNTDTEPKTQSTHMQPSQQPSQPEFNPGSPFNDPTNTAPTLCYPQEQSPSHEGRVLRLFGGAQSSIDHECLVTHLSTSSKSLRDPVPMPTSSQEATRSSVLRVPTTLHTAICLGHADSHNSICSEPSQLPNHAASAAPTELESQPH